MGGRSAALLRPGGARPRAPDRRRPRRTARRRPSPDPGRARPAGLRGRPRLHRRAGANGAPAGGPARRTGGRRQPLGAAWTESGRLDRARSGTRRARPPERGGRAHVAWATTDADQARWVQRLDEAGIGHTGIVDRHYFHSVYFREPGGVLFELATAEPGFTVDGPPEQFGRTVILPPWLEGSRETIVGRLTPLPDPRAGWPARPVGSAPSA
ncbi:MAG: VOC family protein [Candidatus Dormiibacterota bacterium]